MIQKRAGIVVLVIAFAVLLGLALYATFGHTSCVSTSCFQDSMARCSLASYIHEEPQASWKYDIQGRQSSNCAIKVTLLQAKEGDLELRGFEGHSMTCTYPLGVIAFPEKDMAKCHGLLKEDLQGLIIKKLHQYVLDNLGEIASGLV